MTGVLTAFIIFVLFPGIILGFVLLSRYLKYRETLTMIEHGITPPDNLPGAYPPGSYPPGAYPPPGYPPAVYPSGAYSPASPPTRNSGPSHAQLIWGLVLAAIGLALTLALWPIGFIASSASGGAVRFPLGLGPWMLAGFIPLFVGLSLLLAYALMQPPKEEGRPTPPTPLPTGEGRDVGRHAFAPSNTAGHVVLDDTLNPSPVPTERDEAKSPPSL